MNLGIGGYALSQECLALRRFMVETADIDRAFLVVFVGNDLEFGAYPSKTTFVDSTLSFAMTFWNVDHRPHSGHGHASHSRLLFTLQNAWRRLHPAPPTDSAPATIDGRRWIYDEKSIGNRLDQHRRGPAALRDDAASRSVPVTVVILPERDQVYVPE